MTRWHRTITFVIRGLRLPTCLILSAAFGPADTKRPKIHRWRLGQDHHLSPEDRRSCVGRRLRLFSLISSTN